MSRTSRLVVLDQGEVIDDVALWSTIDMQQGVVTDEDEMSAVDMDGPVVHRLGAEDRIDLCARLRDSQ